MLNDQATTSVAVKYGETQLAVYHVPRRGLYASQQMYVCVPLIVFILICRAWRRCPHRRAFVLDHGIISDTPNGDLVRRPYFHMRIMRQVHLISLSTSHVLYTNGTSP